MSICPGRNMVDGDASAFSSRAIHLLAMLNGHGVTGF